MCLPQHEPGPELSQRCCLHVFSPALLLLLLFPAG
jgi:hypothetical protein